jgi:hypothetical protein
MDLELGHDVAVGFSNPDFVATGYPFNRSNLEGWRLRGLV